MGLDHTQTPDCAGHAGARAMLNWSVRGLLAVFLTLAVLAAGHGDFRPSAFDLTVAPHKYSLVRWEVTHFLDKWVHKLSDLMLWTNEASREERIRQSLEFFRLGERLRDLERELTAPGTANGVPGPQESGSGLQAEAVRAEIKALEERRRSMQSTVEETIEAEISAVLSQEGFASRVGMILPPVDTVFSESPAVLVLSPRDRIQRLETVLMRPGLDNETRTQIEEQVFQEQDLAALVENTGGVAVYPSVVSRSHGLHHALVVAAHEWLHHWFFFQPLGQHFEDSPQMITLNETAATLGGQAIGDRVYTAITGQQLVSHPAPPLMSESEDFHFNDAMRQTRQRAEELLGQGKIEEAEAYMEQRRQLMAAHGYYIRKINQAFFAFHGSYATSAASVSPIDGQLRELQSRSESVEDFIKTVARFSSYQEFEDHLRAMGTVSPASSNNLKPRVR